MRRLAWMLASMLVVGCYADAERDADGTNADVRVSLLTEADGCKIYRFRDGGRAHYFVRCGGSVTTLTGHYESCGKNCTRRYDEETQTEETNE